MKCQLTVHYRNSVKFIEAKSGDNLLGLLREHNIDLTTPCGGGGRCGKCKVKLLKQGGLPEQEMTSLAREVLSPAEKKSGVRLACRTVLSGDLTIELEDKTKMAVLTSGLQLEPRLNHGIKRVTVMLDQAARAEQSDLLQQICDRVEGDDLKPEKVGLAGLKQLEQLDPAKPILVTTYRDQEILSFEQGGTEKGLYGLAIDLGTTTIALFLIDLNSGEELDVYTLLNPQQRFGADLISRINYSRTEPKGVAKLTRVLLAALNAGIDVLLTRHSLKRGQLPLAAIAGNTIMLHTLLAVSAQSIAIAPFTPVFTAALEFKAPEIGLKIASAGMVKLLPAVSGYCGADLMADLLAIDFPVDQWNLLLDIGTNGEIILGKGERLLACSAAAGPAFEGGNISWGMAAVPGAISSYCFNQGQVNYTTIAGAKARGICGSGLVDLIAELLEVGLLDNTGAFRNKDKLPVTAGGLITDYKGRPAFRVVPAPETASGEDIILTQQDIREFQLARGAIMAGIKILLKEAGIDFSALAHLYLAGGFGNYIEPANAVAIGLVPAPLAEKVVKIGNGAGTGAKLYLLDQDLKDYSDELRKKVTYIELSSRKDFQTEFINSMNFCPSG